MKKILYIGKLKKDGFDLFCKAELTGGKLSISGVIGPKMNGDSHGGCGQIDMEFSHKDPKQNDRRYSKPITPEEIDFAKGWNKTKWFAFLDVWHRYHLNDMKATCEHQEALGWDDMAGESLELYKWKLTSEASTQQQNIEEGAMKSLKTLGFAKVGPNEKKLLNLEYWMKTEKNELPDSLAEYYREDTDGHIETKNRGWLDEKEHSLGLLSKACPVCGYKYGTAWKKRTLPAEVVKFIETLPEPKKQPAWI